MATSSSLPAPSCAQGLGPDFCAMASLPIHRARGQLRRPSALRHHRPTHKGSGFGSNGNYQMTSHIAPLIPPTSPNMNDGREHKRQRLSPVAWAFPSRGASTSDNDPAHPCSQPVSTANCSNDSATAVPSFTRDALCNFVKDDGMVDDASRGPPPHNYFLENHTETSAPLPASSSPSSSTSTNDIQSHMLVEHFTEDPFIVQLTHITSTLQALAAQGEHFLLQMLSEVVQQWETAHEGHPAWWNFARLSNAMPDRQANGFELGVALPRPEWEEWTGMVFQAALNLVSRDLNGTKTRLWVYHTSRNVENIGKTNDNVGVPEKTEESDIGLDRVVDAMMNRRDAKVLLGTPTNLASPVHGKHLQTARTTQGG